MEPSKRGVRVGCSTWCPKCFSDGPQERLCVPHRDCFVQLLIRTICPADHPSCLFFPVYAVVHVCLSPLMSLEPLWETKNEPLVLARVCAHVPLRSPPSSVPADAWRD